MAMIPMSELCLRGKRVLIRQDLNAPTTAGEGDGGTGDGGGGKSMSAAPPPGVDRIITSTQRLDAALAAAREASDAGAQVMLMSHVGRPREGNFDPALSLAPMAKYLSKKLGREVRLCAEYLARAPQLADGEVVVLENVRFNRGELADDAGLAKRYAALCDIFVMDAFGAAHRTQASTHGVARYARIACAGPLLLAEIDALAKVLVAPRRPLVAIVGGAKISSKLSALESLAARAEQLIPGGGIANTLIKAAGHAVGNSLIEPGLVDVARTLLRASAARGRPIALPEDVVVAKTISRGVAGEVKPLGALAADDIILDIGPAAIARYRQFIKSAGTLIWNGPLGMFEFPQFAAGTEAIGRAIAASTAFSVAGGGDTLAAAERFGISRHLSCISTGGGAFLEFLEGKTLPALAALEARAAGG
ncbi:MAG: phosphoglycerate kinase [Gammaproteobacteria bacterium]